MATGYYEVTDYHIKVHRDYTLVTVWLESATDPILAGAQRSQIFPPERTVLDILTNENPLDWPTSVDYAEMMRQRVIKQYPELAIPGLDYAPVYFARPNDYNPVLLQDFAHLGHHLVNALHHEPGAISIERVDNQPASNYMWSTVYAVSIEGAGLVGYVSGVPRGYASPD